MKILENKTALITGATRGIGRATAIAFAQAGCNVAFTYLNKHALAEELRAELERLGVKALNFACDATLFDSAHEVVKKVIETFGKIDILVNNAGGVQDNIIIRMTESGWDKVIEANLKPAFNYIHAVVPHMLRARTGSIINLSSSVALIGNVGQANYSAAKAGLIGLTKSLAKELGRKNIRVNVIAPGFIETDMTSTMPTDYKEQILQRVSLKRMGTPQDVAQTALFLASDMSSYITGETIAVHGGLS